jgi:microcystin-dependent protein
MSDDAVILGDMLTPPSPAGGGPPASFDTGTVTQVIDATHIKVDLGDKEVKTLVPANLSGAPALGAAVSVRAQENTYVLDSVTQGSGMGMVPIGAVIDFYGLVIPDGWLEMNGQTFSAAEYPLLAEAIGTTTLLNMADRVAVGKSGTKARGALGGAASVTLTEAQLPAHDHDISHTHTMQNHTHGINHHHSISHTHTYGYHAEFFLEGAGAQKVVAVAGAPNDSTNGPSTTISGTPNDAISDGPSNNTTSAASTSLSGTAGSGSAVSVQNPYAAFTKIIKAK